MFNKEDFVFIEKQIPNYIINPELRLKADPDFPCIHLCYYIFEVKSDILDEYANGKIKQIMVKHYNEYDFLTLLKERNVGLEDENDLFWHFILIGINNKGNEYHVKCDIKIPELKEYLIQFISELPSDLPVTVLDMI
jgi:hypothetical protein